MVFDLSPENLLKNLSILEIHAKRRSLEMQIDARLPIISGKRKHDLFELCLSCHHFFFPLYYLKASRLEEPNYK